MYAIAGSLVRFVFDADGGSRSELMERRRTLIMRGQLTAASTVLIDLRAVITSRPAPEDDAQDLPAADVWPVCRAFLLKTPRAVLA